MPYADPEAKRRYMKDYRKKYKAQQARAQAPPILKIYFCPRFPGLSIGPIRFSEGFLVTADPETQATIENLVDYGRYICSWVANPDPDPDSRQDFVM